MPRNPALLNTRHMEIDRADRKGARIAMTRIVRLLANREHSEDIDLSMATVELPTVTANQEVPHRKLIVTEVNDGWILHYFSKRTFGPRRHLFGIPDDGEVFYDRKGAYMVEGHELALHSLHLDGGSQITGSQEAAEELMWLAPVLLHANLGLSRP